MPPPFSSPWRFSPLGEETSSQNRTSPPPHSCRPSTAPLSLLVDSYISALLLQRRQSHSQRFPLPMRVQSDAQRFPVSSCHLPSLFSLLLLPFPQNPAIFQWHL